MRIKKYFYENKNKDPQSLDSSVRWNDGGVAGIWLLAACRLLIVSMLDKSETLSFVVISKIYALSQ